MNDFEKLLWEQLEEYKEKGDKIKTPEGIQEDKETWENTKNMEYVYKTFPLWGGNVNQDNKYETIHAILPKEDFETWYIERIVDFDGTPLIGGIDNKKRMYFAIKEVSDIKKVTN